MPAQGPLRVLLTVCPLAQCGTQAVLPKPTYVTLSHWPVPHTGTSPSFLERWQAVGCPALCVFLPI